MPVQCQGIFQNWKCFRHSILSRALSTRSKKSTILPHCIYDTSLKTNNIPNSFAALQSPGSKRQCPAGHCAPLSTGTSPLCSTDPGCCTMAEWPPQAKLTCGPAFLSEQFLVHHYSFLLLKEFARQHHSGIFTYPFGLLLVRKKHALYCVFTYTLCTQSSPQTDRSKYSFCTWTILALLEEIWQYSLWLDL